MARRPFALGGRSGRDWLRILRIALLDALRNNLSLVSAGVAFYVMLGIFPALAAFVSVYGLVADPASVGTALASIQGVFPKEAASLIDQQLGALISASRGKLSLGLVVSTPLALWPAWSGAMALMTALNIAYRAEERRGLITQYLVGLAISLAALSFALVALVAVALVPVVIGHLPLLPVTQAAASLMRWPVLAGLFMAGVAGVYRFGPCRAGAGDAWLSAGAVAATALWLLGSGLFSLYVTEFASYDKTYGSLGAVVVLLMWLYLTVLAILVGAEINAVAAADPPLRRD